MYLLCFPPAARPSSCSISAASNFAAAAIAPVKFVAIRAGVTDFGSTTKPFATKKMSSSRNKDWNTVDHIQRYPSRMSAGSKLCLVASRFTHSSDKSGELVEPSGEYA